MTTPSADERVIWAVLAIAWVQDEVASRRRNLIPGECEVTRSLWRAARERLAEEFGVDLEAVLTEADRQYGEMQQFALDEYKKKHAPAAAGGGQS